VLGWGVIGIGTRLHGRSATGARRGQEIFQQKNTCDPTRKTLNVFSSKCEKCTAPVRRSPVG